MVSQVSPLKLGVGDVMTITGKNFRKGKNKNTVVFKRDGGRAVFVKAPDATTTKIGVTVPAKLLPFMKKKKGKRTYTRFPVVRGDALVAYVYAEREPTAADLARLLAAGS